MKIRHAAVIILVTLFAATPLVRAQSGKVVTDNRKTCQLTVPADWTVELSTGYSPGKKISATVNGAVSRGTFEEGKSTVKRIAPPVKVMQDDAKRLLFSFDPGLMGGGKSGWYEVMSTTPVCAASFMFPPDTNQATLKSVADTLAPTKK